ncbi:hypothetical protein VC83_02465 [Pseudogymnoascus destructans]|uniref:CCHC-type domain-containing protein n=1 Tax=Pseudogymnoascus destructans TaxID=655981 RepID=A0A177AFT0_9PEZI|nr:uncharacterized protein VC83_02465 [Pseudogymnoascus destructans]OAF60979.1 hypothetical protein VC83_02465 [Pseudogymnoascus destructans]
MVLWDSLTSTTVTKPAVIPEISRTASGSGFDSSEQAEEIVDKSVDSYKLPEVKLFRIGHDTHPRQYVEKADIKHTPRQGRSTVQNDYQTNHCCSYDRWAIRRHPESNGAQIREVKDLLVILSSNLRSNERLAHETPPRQFNCRVFGTLVLPQFQGRHECTPRTLQIAIRNQPSSEKTLPLSDGVEHTFLQWSASIRDRLVVNDDHYLTDVSRRVLIWGTTTGLAKTYLEPQYLSATHGFRSAEEMMDLLGSYYLTGNETEQARNLFDDLQMGEKGHAAETFPEFKARFQSAASQDNCVVIIKNQWNGEYQTMVRELTAFDQERRRNNELNPLPALARTSTRTTDTAKLSVPTRATPALFTRTAFLPKPAIPERVRTTVPAPSGNCFKCGKPGHFQDKCPLNATIK